MAFVGEVQVDDTPFSDSQREAFGDQTFSSLIQQIQSGGNEKENAEIIVNLVNEKTSLKQCLKYVEKSIGYTLESAKIVKF